MDNKNINVENNKKEISKKDTTKKSITMKDFIYDFNYVCSKFGIAIFWLFVAYGFCQTKALANLFLSIEGIGFAGIALGATVTWIILDVLRKDKIDKLEEENKKLKAENAQLRNSFTNAVNFINQKLNYRKQRKATVKVPVPAQAATNTQTKRVFDFEEENCGNYFTEKAPTEAPVVEQILEDALEDTANLQASPDEEIPSEETPAEESPTGDSPNEESPNEDSPSGET